MFKNYQEFQKWANQFTEPNIEYEKIQLVDYDSIFFVELIINRLPFIIEVDYETMCRDFMGFYTISHGKDPQEEEDVRYYGECKYLVLSHANERDDRGAENFIKTFIDRIKPVLIDR